MAKQKSKSKRSPAVQANLDAARGAKGLDRERHFAAGGTVAAWRGRSARFVDRRRESDRLACRKPYG